MRLGDLPVALLGPKQEQNAALVRHARLREPRKSAAVLRADYASEAAGTLLTAGMRCWPEGVTRSMTGFDTRAGNQRRRSRTWSFGPTWAGAATITAMSFGSRRALRAPSRSRPMHQPTRLGSAIWMIAPSAIFPVSSSAFGP